MTNFRLMSNHVETTNFTVIFKILSSLSLVFFNVSLFNSFNMQNESLMRIFGRLIMHIPWRNRASLSEVCKQLHVSASAAKHQLKFLVIIASSLLTKELINKNAQRHKQSQSEETYKNIHSYPNMIQKKYDKKMTNV